MIFSLLALLYEGVLPKPERDAADDEAAVCL